MGLHPNVVTAQLEQQWQSVHWESLTSSHLTLNDITPVIQYFEEMAKNSEHLTYQLAGRSFAKRPIHHFTLGNGPLVILAWTQMHGDEPTATAAVLDWLKILTNDTPPGLPADWLSKVTLHIVPMLNPDGAQAKTRINAQGIDINRDARSLQTPEGQLLQTLATELRPDVAFNLHDQNPYYTAGQSENPATISFLAPAYHVEKHVDSARLRAKQLIAEMRATLSHWLPEHIGRYDDTYSLRSFGDNIAALGASTILIESGAHRDDPMRQVARKMNTIGLHTALLSLLSGTYQLRTQADYYQIPENHEDGLTDIKITGLTQTGFDQSFIADISIKVDGSEAIIDSIGDLSVISSFAQVDASGLTASLPKGYSLTAPLTLDEQGYCSLLEQGYGYFIGATTWLTNQTNWPVLIRSSELESATLLMPGAPAYWLLTRDNKVVGAILNGELVSVRR